MVWDPPKQKVNVTRMIIYSFIPILAIYAGWRIQKFWVLLGIDLLVGYGLGTSIEGSVPSPFGYLISISVTIILSIYFVRYFARKYNEKINSSSDENLF